MQNTCPDYYLLPDGRQFCDFSRAELSRCLWDHGIVGWPYHCAISALEHLYRMGAKPDEEQTDWESFQWWWQHVPNLAGKQKALDMVMQLRKEAGR